MITEIILNDIQLQDNKIGIVSVCLFWLFIVSMFQSRNDPSYPWVRYIPTNSNVETNKENSAQWGEEVIRVMIITIVMSEKRKCYEKYFDNFIS